MGKRRSESTGLVVVLSVIGGFVLANLLGVSLQYRKNKKKMAEKDKQFNQMHSVTMGNAKVTVGEKTQNLYLTCLSGKLDVNFEKLPENKDIYMDLFSVCGKVTINLPFGVEAKCDGIGRFERNRSVLLDYGDGHVATLHIERKSYFSELVIRPVRKWSK